MRILTSLFLSLLETFFEAHFALNLFLDNDLSTTNIETKVYSPSLIEFLYFNIELVQRNLISNKLGIGLFLM